MFGKTSGLAIFLVTGFLALWAVPAQASGPGEGIGHLIVLGIFLLITAAASYPLRWLIAALVWKQRVPPGWLFATGIGEIVALVACFLASALIGGPRASYTFFLILACLLYLPCAMLINFRLMRRPLHDTSANTQQFNAALKAAVVGVVLPILFLIFVIPFERHEAMMREKRMHAIMPPLRAKPSAQPPIIQQTPAPPMHRVPAE
ncbi:MAG: hypothetical protein AB1473_12210 [Thermodesulfobacteriota bacterium]